VTGKSDKVKHKTRHYFFLNPYDDCAFTKCPKCRNKTKIRKFPLVIHIEPAQLFLLNKKCKYCTECDLVIAKQSEVEALMAAAFEKRTPELLGNEYVVAGVMDRKDWKDGKNGVIDSAQTVDRVYIFKDLLSFEPSLPGWYKERKESKG
jgi:hypothetical protein